MVKSPFLLVILVKSEFLLEKINICLGEIGIFPVFQLGSTNKSRLVMSSDWFPRGISPALPVVINKSLVV